MVFNFFYCCFYYFGPKRAYNSEERSFCLSLLLSKKKKIPVHIWPDAGTGIQGLRETAISFCSSDFYITEGKGGELRQAPLRDLTFLFLVSLPLV